MVSSRKLEKMDFDKFEKFKGRELVFIPKEEFIDWYKTVNGVSENVEMIKIKDDYQECPNCKGGLESYNLYVSTGCELWYLCPNCNYAISKKQHKSLMMIILKALNIGLKED